MNDELDNKWSSLDINVKRLWRIEATISSLIVAALLLPADIALHDAFDQLPFPGFVAMIVVAVAYACWRQYLVGRRFHFWRYKLGDADLCVAYGIYWRTRAYVPRVRIQHVDVTAGPISRMLGLAILSVFVGGRAGAVATIPGLSTAEADRLRKQLLRLEDAQTEPPPVVGEDVPPYAASERQTDPQDGGSTDV